MGRVLLFTNRLERNPAGGRELLCKLNHDVLVTIYEKKLFVFEVMPRSKSVIGKIWNALFGYIDGVDLNSILSSIEIIEREGISKIFVDGSNLGAFVSFLKKRYPAIQVITFFHNVEVRFFWGAFCQRKSPYKLAVLVSNYIAERKAVIYSDKLVCLSQRDSTLLGKIYGRSATNISPMALEDKLLSNMDNWTSRMPERIALFVGGSFYANYAGIAWFVREVAPRIDIPVYIVGRGFELLKKGLEVPGKVVVIGEVHNLGEWYARSSFVIAPIFDGSGMKTKVAEALMYGKKIIGTAEAFAGYEDIAHQVGSICNTSDEFVSAISVAQQSPKPSDLKLRNLFLQKYSFASKMKAIKRIMG